MLFVIFIDNTWTARRLHIILNNSLFLFPGGDCSREIEEMVHGREQKAAGLKGKSLNRSFNRGCWQLKVLRICYPDCVFLIKLSNKGECKQ